MTMQRDFTRGHFPQLHLPEGVKLEMIEPQLSAIPQPTLVRTAILSNDQLAPEHFLMRLHAPELALGEPGQFAMIRPAPETNTHPLLPRPMAIYRYSPESGGVEFVYRVVGEGTRAMSERRPGEEAEVVGPVGRGFFVDPSTKGVVVIGRGIGVCSITALAEAAAHRGLHVFGLLSGRTPEVVLGAEILRDIGAEYVTVNDADGTSGMDNVRSWLEPLIAGGRVEQAFVCGSNRLIDLTARLAARSSVDVQVSLEAHMACGLGYCHSCATGAFGQSEESPLVCQDGPAFRCSLIKNGKDHS